MYLERLPNKLIPFLKPHMQTTLGEQKNSSCKDHEHTFSLRTFLNSCYQSRGETR